MVWCGEYIKVVLLFHSGWMVGWFTVCFRVGRWIDRHIQIRKYISRNHTYAKSDMNIDMNPTKKFEKKGLVRTSIKALVDSCGVSSWVDGYGRLEK